MNKAVKQALERDRTIDITTRGRTTGQPRRTEIWFHNLDGHLYITGTPGRRDWYANLLANPEFTFHLKQRVQVDLSARATPFWIKPSARTSWAESSRDLGGTGTSTLGWKEVL
jgi:deazaflavin-dependent oxidoreductase (nitroreductase family)